MDPSAKDGAGAETPAHGCPERETLGRYQLLEEIGSGGMGVVYRAFDPELDRAIAIKRLFVGSGDPATWLLREAQAIAHVSHVHVVQVYDVGRDADSDDLFIAMELVEGITLRAWLDCERSWKEVAAIFLQAGEGLAAAHAQGVVHRDFKPENVLVDAEGRAKVVDFGLAKLGSDDQPAGARLGTPAYMPPEQVAGGTSDPAADQFSFAVALYEGLTGRLPFAGKTITDYALAVLDGNALPFPPRSAVPRRLQRAIFTALNPASDARHASMTPLLDELRIDAGRGRRRMTVAGVALLAAAGTFGAIRLAERDADAPCRRLGDAVDEVWNDARREQVVTALGAVDVGFARDAAASTASAVDDLAERWREARQRACLAEGIDAREQGLCLERNLARQRDLVAVLLEPHVEMVAHTLAATEQVSLELGRCASPAWLDQLEAIRDLPHLADSVDTAQRHVDLGEVEQGLAVLDAMGDPEELPAPVALRWGVIRSQLLRAGGRIDAARESLDRAAWSGLGSSAPIAAGDWHAEYADLLYELDAGEAMGRHYARAAQLYAAHLGPSAGETLVAAASLGHLPFSRGEYAEALNIYDEAAREAASALPETAPQRLLIDHWIAEALPHVGRTMEARAELEDLVRRFEEVRGPKHPQTLAARESLGLVKLVSGEAQEAERDLEAVLAGLGEAGVDELSAVDRSTLLANIGAARLQADHFVEAEEAMREAKRVLAESGLPPEHAKMLAIDANLAQIAVAAGRGEDAVGIYERVLASMRRAGIDGTTNAVMVRFNFGGLLLDLGRAREAIAVLGEGLRHAEIHDDRVLMGRLYQRLGQAHDALGRRHEADEALEEARMALAGEPYESEWVAALREYQASRARGVLPR
jgi:tetratricopeptide (TPR) repeat protein